MRTFLYKFSYDPPAKQKILVVSHPKKKGKHKNSVNGLYA